MAISPESLAQIPASFASVSVGTSSTPLPSKLAAISSAGFTAIELGFPDLLSFASTFHKKEIKENDYDSLCSAGTEVKKLCEKNNLGIMMLQPFSNFEGWPKGSNERKDAFERAKGWIRIMEAVGTDMLQVGSSDSPDISSDFHVLADDLRELCDLLAEHKFRLAYENWYDPHLLPLFLSFIPSPSLYPPYPFFTNAVLTLLAVGAGPPTLPPGHPLGKSSN